LIVYLIRVEAEVMLSAASYANGGIRSNQTGILINVN